MRLISLPVALVLVIACASPSGPHADLQGSWQLVAAHRYLEPTILTIDQIGDAVVGKATVFGIDPAGNQGPVMPLIGVYAPPALTFTVSSGDGYSVTYRASLVSADHLTGVLTFSDVIGGGTDTVSYVRN